MAENIEVRSGTNSQYPSVRIRLLDHSYLEEGKTLYPEIALTFRNGETEEEMNAQIVTSVGYKAKSLVSPQPGVSLPMGIVGNRTI